jgi:cell division initiation protein
MRITPIDIQQQQFKTRMFGYDTAAVDQFLELLADQLERLMSSNNELKEKMSRTTSSLDELRERENALQQMLLAAQQVTEGLKENARREAEIIMADAHMAGERIIRTAEDKRLVLLEEVQDLKRQKITFENGLRSLVGSHLQLLDMDQVLIEEAGGLQARCSLLDSVTEDEINASFRLP